MKSITLLALAIAALALTGCETGLNGAGTNSGIVIRLPFDWITTTQPVQIPAETQRVVTTSEVKTVQPVQQVTTYAAPIGYAQPSTLTYRPQPGLEK